MFRTRAAILSVLAFAMAVHPALARSDWQTAAQPAGIDGLRIVRAEATFDDTGQPAVLIRFDKPSAKRIREFTAAHVNERIDVLVDGKVVSAPYIREAIPGPEVLISGSFTPADLTAMVDRLHKNAAIELRVSGDGE